MNVAVSIYRRRFWVLFRLVATVILPVEVVYAVVFTAAAAGSANSLSVVVLVFNGQLATATCLKAVSDTYLGVATSWRASMDFIGRGLGAVVLLALIEVVLVGAGFLLFVVPGIYLLVALLVSTPAMILERLNPVSAMQRSRQLVQGMWLRSAGTYVLASILVFLVALIPSLLFIRVSAGARVSDTHPLAGEIAAVVTSMLTTPFMAIVVVLIYYDLRVRKEGLSLESLASGVDTHPGEIDRRRFDRFDEPPYPDESR